MIISSTNYADSRAYIIVNITGKRNAGVTISGEDLDGGTMIKTYGDPDFTLTAKAESPGDPPGTWTWTSSNTDAATVDNDGKVTVKNRGETEIKATYVSESTVGHATITLTVAPKSLSGAVVTVSRHYPYTGIKCRPADSDVKVTLNGKELIGGTDYSFTPTERRDAGTSVLMVQGNGNYWGSTRGEYTIDPVPLIITTGSAGKPYDGSALTSAETSVSGLVHGEVVLVTATGSQTEVGSSSNTYSINWYSAKENNYTVTEKLGTLTVTDNSGAADAGNRIVLTAASDSKIYDGTPLTNSSVAASGLPDGFTVTATASGSATNVSDDGVNRVDDGFVIRNAAGEDRTASFSNVEKKEGRLTILPKSLSGATVSLDKTAVVWNGQAQSVTVTGVMLNGAVLEADDYMVSGEMTGTDPNTYIVTVTGRGNYQDTAYAEWTISLDKLIDVVSENVEVDYDGAPHGITVTVIDPASGAKVRYGTAPGSYDLDASPTQTDAGKLTVYYQVTADGYDPFSGFATVTVNQVMIDFTPPEAISGLVYDETEQKLVIPGFAKSGALQYALGTDMTTLPNAGWSAAIPTGKEAGTYYVWYRVTGDQNHQGAASRPIPVTIRAAGVSYDVINVDNAEYTIGSGQPTVITVKRSIDDDKTFGNFLQVEVDDRLVGSGNYTIKSGSLILTFRASWLDTLVAGTHPVRIRFTDGIAETSLNILAQAPKDTPPPKEVPKTGDSGNPVLWLSLILIGFAGVLLTVICRTSRKRE